MPVIGNQGNGLTYDTAVSGNLSFSQEYTVPPNRIFKGIVSFTSNGSGYVGVSNANMSSNGSSNGEQPTYVELGPGQKIRCESGSAGYAGNLYTIG